MTASFTLVLVLAAALWAATVANTITIRSSDPAGNALSHAFGVLMAIALWVLLAILLVLAFARQCPRRPSPSSCSVRSILQLPNRQDCAA
jgi:hypothetical protein